MLRIRSHRSVVR